MTDKYYQHEEDVETPETQTEQYYGREDEVETPETQLDNFRAQEGATRAVDIWAQETLVNIYDKTLEMWNAADAMRAEAEQRGDADAVEQLTLQQNGLSEVYKGAEHMQQNLLHTNTAMKSVLEAAQALGKQKQQIEKELSDLVEAIEEADYNDDRLRPLIERVEEDVYEMASEAAYDDANESASESAYDNMVSDIYKTLRQMSPQTTYMVAERFFNALKGDYPLNDIQRGLLLSLLNTITLD